MSGVYVALAISAIATGYGVSASNTANTRARDAIKTQDIKQQTLEKQMADRQAAEKRMESEAILKLRNQNMRQGAAGGVKAPAPGTTLGMGSGRGAKTTLGM